MTGYIESEPASESKRQDVYTTQSLREEAECLQNYMLALRISLGNNWRGRYRQIPFSMIVPAEFYFWSWSNI